MIESDEKFTIEDELDHYKHVSAIRASKIAKLKQQLKEANQEIEELYSGRLGACHTCEQVADFNIKLEQQLKEAENVIVGLSNYYDLNSNAWSESEYKFLLDAKEYIDKYKGDS